MGEWIHPLGGMDETYDIAVNCNRLVLAFTLLDPFRIPAAYRDDRRPKNHSESAEFNISATTAQLSNNPNSATLEPINYDPLRSQEKRFRTRCDPLADDPADDHRGWLALAFEHRVEDHRPR